MNINATSGVAFVQNQPLPDFVLIYGEEPQLNLEVLDALRQKAKKEGYEERQRLDMQGNSDWSRLINEIDTPSLFASKRLIEMHCEDKKLSKIASDTLMKITDKPLVHIKLVLYAPNLNKIVNQPWYKKVFADNHLAIRSFNLYPAAFQKQIEQRLKKAELKLSPLAKDRLLAYCQGNLLAAQQAINRLTIHPQHTGLIDEDLLQNLLSDFSQFKVFALTDAILSANWLEAYKIASKLSEEGNNEETLITWLLQHDISVLIQLINRPSNEHDKIYKAFKVSKFQQKRYQIALQHFSAPMARTTLALAAKLDAITKGAEHGNYWQTLRQYLLLRAR